MIKYCPNKIWLLKHVLATIILKLFGTTNINRQEIYIFILSFAQHFDSQPNLKLDMAFQLIKQHFSEGTLNFFSLNYSNFSISNSRYISCDTMCIIAKELVEQFSRNGVSKFCVMWCDSVMGTMVKNGEKWWTMANNGEQCESFYALVSHITDIYHIWPYEQGCW
jgi:hypothetical protein